MSFLYPLAFVFALTLPVIVLLYLLRLRRQKVVISSILLWRKTLEDLQANAPFQKLRNNLLLWLQLLIAALAVLALARPVMKLTAQQKSYIVLVDTSASMKAREVEGARIELARAALIEMIDGLRSGESLWRSLAGEGGEEMMIIAFDREARIIQTFTDSKSLLKNAVHRVEARDAASRIYDALALARSIGESNPKIEIIILSDGALHDLDRSPAALPPIRFSPIGEADDNVGIVGLELRESFGRDTETQLFATVENFGRTAVTSLLECRINDQLMDVKEVSLEPASASAVIFSNLPETEGNVELRLARRDALEADNVAYGRLPARKEIQVLLVTSGNYFLERLLTSDSRYAVFQTTPGEYASSQGMDITVFDNYAPESLGPGSYLMFNAIPPMDGFRIGADPLELPPIMDWSRVHPLTRYVRFDALNINRALDVTAPTWAQSLAEGEISPLIFAVERDQRQVVAVAFDIFDSDWPLRVSFPVFIANSLSWLSQGSASGSVFSYAAGQSVSFAPREGEREIVVESPSGDRRQLDFADGRAQHFSQTDENGFYRVTGSGGDLSFAVNLLDRDESDIAPRDSLALRDRDVVGETSLRRANREIWRWIAAAALAVLALEWIVYCRRTWI